MKELYIVWLFFCNFKTMKKVLLFLLVFISLGVDAQYKEALFKFNAKKFIKNNIGNQYNTNEILFNLIDINGQKTTFRVIEKNQPQQRLQGIYSFKGKSLDNKKNITLTLTKKSLSGIYTENAVSYFIEPVSPNCGTKYKVYTGNKEENKIGQEKDFVDNRKSQHFHVGFFIYLSN